MAFRSKTKTYGEVFISLSVIYVLYSLFFVISGIIFYGFILLFGEQGHAAPIGPVISIYAFSWIIGYITPGASGGMGVREAAIIGFLSGIVGEPASVMVAIALRLVTIIGDFSDVRIFFFTALPSDTTCQHLKIIWLLASKRTFATCTTLMKRITSEKTHGSYVGYARDPALRNDAASGGAVSAITRYLLDRNIVGMVLASRLKIVSGRFVPEIVLAEKSSDLDDCKKQYLFLLPYRRRKFSKTRR